MNGDYWIIRNDLQKASAAAAVATCQVSKDSPVCVQITPYSEDRSGAQNRLSHKWYGEISQQGGEYTPAQIHDRCKYRYGIPLLVDDPVFTKFWERVLSTQPTYEEIVDEIMPITPVTRLMTVKQMTQYLNDMQREMGQKYKLTDPELYGI